MNRREFIKICGLLGITLPLQSIATSHKTDNLTSTHASDTILIIGAGAAGLSLGYLLAQRGIDFQIIEASSTYGGRLKNTTTFADFPIPLGAEWLHVAEKELTNIVNNPNTDIKTQLQAYSGREKIGFYNNGKLHFSSLTDAFGDDFSDKKFINSTWFDFFATYIVPSIRTKIRLNTQIVSINYQGKQVIATDHKGVTYQASKVIVTAPLKILQDGDIRFKPSLSTKKVNAIQTAPVWGGIKVFLKFTKRFYPTYLVFPDSETQTGQRAYFDAAYAQKTASNILGLFAIGSQAEQYQQLSGNAQRDYILNELDEIFDNKASATYVKHIVQDWNNEPFIRSAYLADVASSSISRTLSTSVNHKLFFAGDAYTQEDDWGGVHNAVRSARDVMKEILTAKKTNE